MEATNQHKPQIELWWWHHAAIFLLACGVIISRRPDAVFHAQFWAEDGHVWYADAYNLGWWPSLFRVFEGYIEVFPRLGAAVALLVPLHVAPLIMNILAICVRALPVNLLLSVRSSVWGALTRRTIMACIYLTLPNTGELNSTITNSQWFLALSVFLILVASRPQAPWERIFDDCILLLCSLSGPFCIFLLPIAAFLLWKHCEHRNWFALGALIVGCLMQVWNLSNGGYGSRFHGSLGASAITAVRLLATQFYISALLGPNGLATNASIGWVLLFVAITITGTVLAMLCLFNSQLEYKLLFAFSAMVLAAALKAPLIGEKIGMEPWAAMSLGAGTRYWFFPCLWMTWSILMLLDSKTRSLRAVSTVLLFVLCFGIFVRWRIPALPDLNFAEDAKNFESAPSGTSTTFLENPQGWTLQLVKHKLR